MKGNSILFWVLVLAGIMLFNINTREAFASLSTYSIDTDTILVEKENIVDHNLKSDVSNQMSNSEKGVNIKEAKKPFIPNSKVAVLWSIIPGGGQIYNRQYWKLPIVAGAYTACYYAISWNQNNLIEYANAYRELMSENPLEYDTWKDFVPYGSDPETYIKNESSIKSLKDKLKRGRDFFRRNRDLSIIVTAAVYAIVMVDAYVDAELFTFDITPNVSLAVEPTVQPISIQNNQSYYGVKFALNF